VISLANSSMITHMNMLRIRHMEMSNVDFSAAILIFAQFSFVFDAMYLKFAQ